MLDLKIFQLDINAIGSWPLFLRICIIILILITLELCLWNLIGKDNLDKTNEQQKKLQSIQNDVSWLNANLYAKNNDLANNDSESNGSENNDSEKNTLREIENQLNILIPDQMSLSGCVEEISMLAFRSKIKLLALKVRKEAVVDKLLTVPIELTFVGKYNYVTLFVHDLELLKMFVVIKKINITKFSANDDDLLKVKIAINVYFAMNT